MKKKIIEFISTLEEKNNYSSNIERITDLVEKIVVEFPNCNDTTISNAIQKHYYDNLGFSNNNIWKMIDEVVNLQYSKLLYQYR